MRLQALFTNPVRLSEPQSDVEDEKAASPLPEVALVLVRLDHVASVIVNANLRGFGHGSKAPMHHEQHGRSMKARPQRQRRETAMLAERAQRLIRESRKLLEQREAQLRQQVQFLEQHALRP